MTSDTVHYYCAAGYVIEGKDIATCQPDGTWDNEPPHCYRMYLVLDCMKCYFTFLEPQCL